MKRWPMDASPNFNGTRISLRLEGDLIRSQLYSQGQNNFMFCTSFVIR
jgi:hypothetical protein